MADLARRDNRAGRPLQCGRVPRSAQRLGLAGAAAALLSGACLPEGSPPWLVDHPIAAAVRVDVAERGPYGPEPPRPDAVVASVMPGDRIRATPFIVGPAGPADLAALRPAWFYCAASQCFPSLTDGSRPRDCGVEAVPPDETCSLGAGPEALLQLGDPTGVQQLIALQPALFMVSGTPGGPSTELCLARLRDVRARGETLEQCLLFMRLLPIGPAWRLILLGTFLGLPDVPATTVIPNSAVTSEPSLFPEVLPFELTITGTDGAARERVAVDAATIAVRPGDLVEIVAPLDPADAQSYVDASTTNGQLLGFTANVEVMSSSWLFSRDVPFRVNEPQVILWQVPDDAVGAIHAYYLLSDTRSIVWAWLRFEVAAP